MQKGNNWCSIFGLCHGHCHACAIPRPFVKRCWRCDWGGPKYNGNHKAPISDDAGNGVVADQGARECENAYELKSIRGRKTAQEYIKGIPNKVGGLDGTDSNFYKRAPKEAVHELDDMMQESHGTGFQPL